MKFEQALQAMREGKKVKLSSWSAREFIKLSVKLVDEDENGISYDDEVILAEDWEVVE
jgi:hypothetical protein